MSLSFPMRLILVTGFTIWPLLMECAVGEGVDVLANLHPGHPRLLLSNPELDTLRTLEMTDPDLQRMWKQVREQATGFLDAPPLRHELKGPRLLAVSRACLDRVYSLALVWRWTGESAYADAAVSNLKTVCAFQDWNPSHFLDVAEMTHAVAIGYDWLYDYMDETTRETIRTGLIRLGLEEGVKAYDTKAWWTTSEYNWNQVCNSGLMIGALAIADTDPEYGQRIIPRGVASLPVALASYNPEGVWNEGPAYWHYATRYTAYGLAALTSALGTDFGLGDVPGLRETAWFPLMTTGPTGLFLNFADSGANSRRKGMPALVWLARTYDLPAIAAQEHATLDTETADALHVIWYVPRPSGERAIPPLDQIFHGKVPVAVTRSAWNDRMALFAGVKGGYNQVNHGHLDLGNFELDALGVRWARDLGSDDYNLPGYFDKKPNGKRWNYYRNISQSHNVPLISGEGQDPSGTAEIIRAASSAEGAFAVIDLSSAYPSRATSVLRGVASVAQRKALLVQDEFTLKEPAPITWGMTTDGDITIVDAQHATLLQNGQHLDVRILSPNTALFSKGSAAQAAPQNSNTGVQRLEATIPPEGETVTISIFLCPEWPDAPRIPAPVPQSLSDWNGDWQYEGGAPQGR